MPDRAGGGTQVIAHIPLSQLRALPGAQDLEDAWIRARLAEDGYLAGKDAETAACDAPVVTGAIDPDVIDQMISLARTQVEGQAGHLVPQRRPRKCRSRNQDLRGAAAMTFRRVAGVFC